MANSAQARKRIKQNRKHYQHNASLKSMMRTSIKKSLSAIKSQEANIAKSTYIQTTMVLDRMASKGIIHKNKAARLKSRLSSKLKAISL